MFHVIQSWDDGIVDDIRLADICRKHRAKASFNLNPGLHGSKRGDGWKFGEKDVMRLARNELEQVYRGFEIANHTMTHPHLTSLSPDRFETEIRDARKILQDWFGQAIDGFCYPYGTCTGEAQKVVEATGHVFARHSENLGMIAASPSFRLIKPHGHFTTPDFWSLYELAKKGDGYFFFWGHSYEMVSEKMWQEYDSALKKISDDPDAVWMTLGEFARIER